MRHVTDSPFTGKLCSPIKRLVVLLSVLGASTVLLAVTNDDHTRLDHVIAHKTLTVVSVAGNTTHFNKDQFLYGFGYDLARAYANDLNVTLKFKTVANAKLAFKAVRDGKADIAMTTATPKQLEQSELTHLDLSCNDTAALSTHGLNPNVRWTFDTPNDPLTTSANGFVCQKRQLGTTARMATFYEQKTMQSKYIRASFSQNINDRLPLYKPVFQESAKQHRLDWQLLAAMGYQESMLDATAVSPTGVSGLMMLTENTARELGVIDRNDPTQSIQGGALYFKQLQRKYADVPASDRLWISLAAYNMGPGAVDQVRKKLRSKKQDPDSWANIYQYLSDNAAKNSRFTQCMQYVTRIRTYLETIKQDRKLSRL